MKIVFIDSLQDVNYQNSMLEFIDSLARIGAYSDGNLLFVLVQKGFKICNYPGTSLELGF